MLVQGLLALTAFGYFFAALGFQRNLFQQQTDWRPWRTVLLISHGMHTLGLGMLSYQMGHLPFASMDEALSTLAWLLIGLYVLLGHRWKIEVVGTVAAPAAAVMTAFSALLLGSTSPARGAWVYVHVISIIASYAAFCLAGICAMLYFVQARLLKKKRLTGFYQMLPSLDRLDRVAYRFILIGFPLMVMGLATAFWIHPGAWAWDPLETLVAVTFLVYLVYLHLRIAGWQGRAINQILLVACLCVMLTMVSFLAPSQFHH